MPKEMALPQPAPLPSSSQIAQTKTAIAGYTASISEIETKIAVSEAKLASIVADTEQTIQRLLAEQRLLEAKVSQARCYLAPIRRLPTELLSEVFTFVFYADAAAAWKLAAVCRLWRELALISPLLWSKIQLETKISSPADTIRLWIERSGTVIPLDIQITLQVANQTSNSDSTSSRSSSLSSPYGAGGPLPSIWHIMGMAGQFNPGGAPLTMPLPYPHPTHSPHSHTHHGSSSKNSKDGASQEQQRASSTWGHVAFYYLTSVLPRWKRFVFKFDRPFGSLRALDSITGLAPLLEEFSVSCTEAHNEARSALNLDVSPSGAWNWLPSSQTAFAPRLRLLELRNMPFRWDSPILTHGSLKSLALNCSTPNSVWFSTALPLNRLLRVVAANPQLESLALSLSTSQPVLPMLPCRLDNLKELRLGGPHDLHSLIDQLILPNLTSLHIEVERNSHNGLEESLLNLLIRSGDPPVTHLAYGSPTTASYYSGLGGAYALPTSILAKLPFLESLSLTSTPIDHILSSLTPSNDDDDDGSDDFIMGQPTIFQGGTVQQLGGAFFGGGIGAAMPGLMGVGGGGPGATGGIMPGAAAAMMAANAGGPNANAGPQTGICSHLNHLALKSVHIHDVTKITKLAQARGRQGTGGGNGGEDEVYRIKKLEIKECTGPAVGEDVIDWLRDVIGEVEYVECTAPQSMRGARTFASYAF